MRAVAKINGRVEGDIQATKELVLGRTADVEGEVASPALVVEEGARFNGKCRRTEAIDEVPLSLQARRSN